ncbi:MAG: hypothetical protein ACP5HK_03670 [Acidilobus sp.]
MTPDVEVAGLGIAGSLLTLRLAQEGFKVTAYDPLARYEKACGEQITLEPGIEGLVKSLGVVKTVVKRVDIFIDGIHLTTIELKGSPKWVIVDKPRLVNELREEARGAGAGLVRSKWDRPSGSLITIDARGPYAIEGRGLSTFAVRLIARVKRWNPEKAWLDFRPRQGGLYWVFPYDADGHLVNAGVGLLGNNNAVDLRVRTEAYLRGKLGQAEAVDFKGAPIAAFAPVRLVSGVLFRVGEAAGLVMAWSGEGNRPAILSSLALSEAIVKRGAENASEVAETYMKSVDALSRLATAARALTLLAVSLRSSVELMRQAPKWFWEGYVRQELSQRDVIKALLEGLAGNTH